MKTEEELLFEKAKTLYPIGTIINCVWGNQKNFTINDYRICGSRGIYSGSNAWIVLDGKWAEIISSPKQEEYKVGDWVITTKLNSTVNFTLGKAYKLGGKYWDINYSNNRDNSKGMFYVIADDKGLENGNSTAEYRKALPSEIPVQNEVIPEYVECIHEQGWSYCIEKNGGVIFHTKKPLALNNEWEKIYKDGRSMNFKPSTKEAYEAQNNPKSPEFIVGKWYKWYQKNHGSFHYGKFDRTDKKNDIFYMSPWICNSNSYQNNGCFSFEGAEQIKELSDLSEIQQYLPEGHVDKIKKDEFVEVRDLKADNYYKAIYGDFYCIVKVEKNGSNTGKGIKIQDVPPKDNDYYSSNSFSNALKWKNAEKSEIDHLEACIKASKFIPKEEALKPNKTEDLTGRWLKALKDDAQCTGLKIGEYAQIKKSEKIRGDFYPIKGVAFGYAVNSIGEDWELMPIGFVPPSKEEKWVPKVGEWVVTLPNSNGWGMESSDIGKVFRVDRISNEKVYFEKKTNSNVETCGSFASTILNKVRKAEPHEIPKEPILDVSGSMKADGFVLPKNWMIAVNSQNKEVLEKWRTNGGLSTSEGYCVNFYNSANGYWFKDRPVGYTEITFEQFQKYVLGNNPKSGIPEFVEWISDTGSGGTGKMCSEDGYKKGKIFCTLTDRIPPSGIIDTNNPIKDWKEVLKKEWYAPNFRESTREAYEAQFSSTGVTPRISNMLYGASEMGMTRWSETMEKPYKEKTPSGILLSLEEDADLLDSSVNRVSSIKTNLVLEEN